MGCGNGKLSKYLTQTFTAHCNAMICQQVTLSGDAEWPKVADAVIEADILGCVPPFTHGVFHRAVRLMRPTMIRESHAVTLTPPSEAACRLPWGWRSSVFLAGMSSRLSMITACCYPLRHVSHSTSAVAKGVTWRLPCRCSLRQLSRRCIKMPLSARRWK